MKALRPVYSYVLLFHSYLVDQRRLGFSLSVVLPFTVYHLSAGSYLWPFLKARALRFYLLHEKGTSGQFKFELKLPWYCLSPWMGYAIGEWSCFLFTHFSWVFLFDFSFCYHHFCIFLFFGVLDISLYFVRDFVFHYLICSRFTVISVNPGLSENPFICKKKTIISVMSFLSVDQTLFLCFY